MVKLGKKLWAVLALGFIFMIVAAPIAYAASSMVKIQAYQGVKIIYNGTTLTGDKQPYIIDNTTYVPLRMLMDHFTKNISWDSVNRQVSITDDASEANKDSQITTLKNQNTALQSTITSLNAKISELQGDDNDDTSVSDIKGTLNEYFGDAGDDYLNDDEIETTISLSGDEDDLVYNIRLDFGSSEDYDDLTDTSESKLKSLMNAVKSKIVSEADGTDYEDADITGKLIDNDNSSYYVKYNGSSYSFSWSGDDSNLSDIEQTLDDYFEDAGDEYLDDDGIDVSISLNGDEDDLAYVVKLDFDDADDYDDLTDTNTTKIKSFLNAIKYKIQSETEDTDYEDADITGKLFDNGNSSYYAEYNGSSYSFSWD